MFPPATRSNLLQILQVVCSGLQRDFFVPESLLAREASALSPDLRFLIKYCVGVATTANKTQYVWLTVGNCCQEHKTILGNDSDLTSTNQTERTFPYNLSFLIKLTSPFHQEKLWSRKNFAIIKSLTQFLRALVWWQKRWKDLRLPLRLPYIGTTDKIKNYQKRLLIEILPSLVQCTYPLQPKALRRILTKMKLSSWRHIPREELAVVCFVHNL